MSKAKSTEPDEGIRRLSSRVGDTMDALRQATWSTAAAILRDCAQAARESAVDGLARCVEMGLAGEALASITPHGNVEKAIAEATRINPRVMRRYRNLARCIVERPDRLMPLLGAGGLAAALRLVDIWRKAERKPIAPAKPLEETRPDDEPPSFDAAARFLWKQAPSLALSAGMAMHAEAALAAEAARVEESMPPLVWKKAEAALAVVMAAAGERGAVRVAEMLAGAAPRGTAERTADGSDLIGATASGAVGAVQSRMAVAVLDAEEGRLASVLANASRDQAAAVSAIVGLALPALGGCWAEVVSVGTAAAGRAEPDAILLAPFVVFVGEGESEDDGDSAAAGVPRLLRHGVVELRVRGRRLAVGPPSSSSLATMRGLGLRLSACGMHLSEPVTTMMAALEAMGGVEDAGLMGMAAALWARDWRLAEGVVPRHTDPEAGEGEAEPANSDSRVRIGSPSTPSSVGATGRC